MVNTISLLTGPQDISEIISKINALINDANSKMLGIALSGGTMTGPLILSADPTAQLGACTKQYADAIISGFVYKGAVQAAVSGNLNVTYGVGTLGVGATLTNADTQAAFSTDGYAGLLNDTILIAGQGNAAQNGLYTLTTVGDATHNWVLTRATNFNQASNIVQGSFINVLNGTTLKNSEWILTSAGPYVVGTTALTFTNFGADFLVSGNNLSDLDNAATARGNLGLGSAALLSSSSLCQTANNLSDVVAATARTNLGLGSAATQSSAAFLLASNNLSDVIAATARTNLGLGSVSTLNAIDLSTSQASGALAAARFPALTGDVITSAGSLTTAISTAWQSYSPALLGATDNPSAITYGTRVGRYIQFNKLVIFKATITTTSITKSTLTDNLRISLPTTASNNVGEVTNVSARVENGTAVLNATIGEIPANANYIQFRSVPTGALSSLLTYGLLSLGTLTNTITFQISGMYETQ